MGTEEQFLTPEQNMKRLRDQAMFADSFTARREAVELLAQKYGMIAIPIIDEVIATIHTSFDPLKIYCVDQIKWILKHKKASAPEIPENG
jgi:hypothetical protein